ncbi:hypothetical protein KR038_007362 [Drosophila bunnanda]|nr:hypothetical protein KR038_007362 [Drosophila bunnanda]
MSAYTCKNCKTYVRGGVILICGHMFCWTCLWPFLADKPSPECPQCQTRLILHEDIMPFYGEGPNVRKEENDFLAEPGAVPRPSGVCFSAPDGFESVGEDEDEDEDEAVELFPRIEFTVKCLKWVQKICGILMLLVWCFVLMI